MAPSQLRLCERLLLLRLCGQTSGFEGPRWDLLQGPSGAIKNDTRTELAILNAICLFLQTDEDGDRVAAALDRDYAPPKLVLARSIPVTQAHIDTAHEFLSLIQDSKGEKLIRATFHIVRRNRLGYVEAKIRHIHEALLTFYTGPASCPQELAEYEPLTNLQEEFPAAVAFLNDLYPEPQEKPAAKDIVFSLLQRLTDLSSENFSDMDEEKALDTFLALLNGGRLLRHARLFQSWATFVPDSGLRQSLDDILQYANVVHIYNAIKRWYSTGDMPIRWIHITEEDRYHQEILDLPHEPISIIAHTLCTSVESEPCTSLCTDHPDLQERWDKHRTVHTRLHPEMQIVLDLSYFTIHFPPTFGRYPQRAVGLSGESCVCCVHWINVFNLMSCMRWTLSISDSPAPLDETWRGAGKKLLDEVMGPRGTFTPDRQVFDFVRSLMLQKFDRLPDW